VKHNTAGIRTGAAGPTLEAQKKKMLRYLDEGHTLREVYRKFEISYSVMQRLRLADVDFDEKVRAITRLAGRVGARKQSVYDPDRKIPPKGSFEDWRMRYLGRPTTLLGQAIAGAMLDETNRVVFILAPPGGGKDTTVGDVLLYVKCDDRSYLRCAWIMENDNFSVRRIAQRIEPYLTDPQAYRVKPYATPGGAVPVGSLIKDYGPFKAEPGMEYPDGTLVAKTTWTQHELRFLASAAAPEAEPDLWATGMGGALYGARVGLMVFSDLVTKENQSRPTDKETDFQWCIGTADSRLDTTGRLVSLGTRVAAEDNHERLMEHYIGKAEPWSVEQTGPLTKTTYTNGVCVIVCVAIWVDEEGEERSYDETRFPLDGKWQLRNGNRIDLAALSIDEAAARNAKRILGLREIRERDPDWFDTAYQQNPSADSSQFDFTDPILDLCSDPRRSYGKALPGEIRVLCVDPARAGGAAWAVLGLDLEEQTIAVVDYKTFAGLGVVGIKQRLIIDPITVWQPRYLSYEVNHEQGVLYDPETQKVIADFGVTVVPHQTHKNRMDREIGVASVASEMRDRRLLFPTALTSDQAKTRLLRQHFKNWDAAPKKIRSKNMRTAHPDDLAMAIWPGVLLARKLFAAAERRDMGMRPAVPASVLRRWQKRSVQAERGRRGNVRADVYHAVDLDRLYLGSPGAD